MTNSSCMPKNWVETGVNHMIFQLELPHATLGCQPAKELTKGVRLLLVADVVQVRSQPKWQAKFLFRRISCQFQKSKLNMLCLP